MSAIRSANAIPSVREIVETGSVKTLFQPILSARQKSIVGLEALSRGLIGVEALSRGVLQASSQLIPPDLLFKQAAEEGVSGELETLCRETAARRFSRLRERPSDLILFLNFDVSAMVDHYTAPGQQVTNTIVNSSTPPPRRRRNVPPGAQRGRSFAQGVLLHPPGR